MSVPPQRTRVKIWELLNPMPSAGQKRKSEDSNEHTVKRQTTLSLSEHISHFNVEPAEPIPHVLPPISEYLEERTKLLSSERTGQPIVTVTNPIRHGMLCERCEMGPNADIVHPREGMLFSVVANGMVTSCDGRSTFCQKVENVLLCQECAHFVLCEILQARRRTFAPIFKYREQVFDSRLLVRVLNEHETFDKLCTLTNCLCMRALTTAFNNYCSPVATKTIE